MNRAHPLRWLVLITVVTLLAPAVALGASPGERAAAPGADYIVVLRDEVDRSAAMRAARAVGAKTSMQYSHALNGYVAQLSSAALASVSADPAVQFVVRDQDLVFSEQVLPTAVDRIDGESSTAASGDGLGAVAVNIAILDSGVDLDHPDLNVVGGVDCVAPQTKKSTYDDLAGHGTAVAGSVAALDNGIGSVGVAPGAPIWAVRVGIGAPKVSAIVCGVDWVSSTRTDADPTNDIAVANMSFSGKGTDDGNCGRTKKDVLHLAICNSVAAGVTYVAGAGNDARDISGSFPATYDEVLTVTALADYDGQPGGLAQPTCATWGPDDTPANFSNFATAPEDVAHTVAAPGTCSLATFAGGGYGLFSGTSLSSPIGAGVVALCIASSACTGLSPSQIVDKLVADAAAYNDANPGYGFAGDPIRPVTGQYFGYLLRAALY